jgi:hypothetical protein
MAAAAQVLANVYGRVWGQPPYQGTTSANAFTNFDAWDSPTSMGFATQSITLHPVTPGQRVGNTSNYIYSVIEVNPTGLTPQPESLKYATNQSVATLATAAG